ncbi:MAG: hypothetical protein JOZ53_06900 [Planctomycetaceae bacterium]|nr:hypothetical protein [Planctomycetaceae bacterium]
MSSNCFEQARDLSEHLSPHDKLRLIEELVQQLLRELPAPEKKPSPSLWGALAHLGPAPSAGDIDEMRSEAWTNFPREDF